MLFDRLRTDSELWNRYLNRSEYESDQSGRSIYSSSPSFDTTIPNVSDKLLDSGFDPGYPDGKDFALCLTHDIDVLSYAGLRWPYRFVQAVAGGRLRHAGRIALSKFSQAQNPLWNFEQIMEMEKKYDARSSFYFLALKKGELDFQYDIGDCKDVLIELDRSGWEVGLHGGHTAFNDPDQMRREKDRLETALGKPINGYRNHYLKFNIPQSWNYLKSTGFSHDSTIGYPDMIGFRNGMCHPYYPFDDVSQKYIDLLEIPLAIMDATLEYYLKFDTETAWTKIKSVINITRARRGVVTILWHNNYFSGSWGELYERILEYGQDQNGWLTSSGQINNWYRKQNYFQEKNSD